MSIRRLVSSILALLASLAFVLPGAGQATASAERDWTLGGRPCSLIAVPSASPVGAGACRGVRPGALVTSPSGTCTLNFLFRGSDGRRYIGTAGHCILESRSTVGGSAGERTWRPGRGPIARDANGRRIGEFAYAVLKDPRDFALIRLDRHVRSSPGVCHFGGPTAVHAARTSGPVVLHHYGNGLGVGAVLPARSGLALGMPSSTHVYAQGVAVPGDSGSAVIAADGRAVGVLVTVGVHVSSLGTSGIDAGVLGITRLAPQLRGAQRALGLQLRLLTAPRG